jgi:hypothetical protein
MSFFAPTDNLFKESKSVNDERIYWLAWSTIKGVGPILLKRIQQHFE